MYASVKSVQTSHGNSRENQHISQTAPELVERFGNQQNLTKLQLR